jgi:hypothetical protein
MDFGLSRLALVCLVAAGWSAPLGASARDYLGYVPAGFAQAGLNFRDQTAAQILLCQAGGVRPSDIGLSKSVDQEIAGFCAKASPIYQAFRSKDCFEKPATAACRQPILLDNALRRDPRLWRLVALMEGRPELAGGR